MNPIQYVFSSQEVANKYSGLITQLVHHYLKLQYELNYKYDRNHHVGDMTTWLLRIHKYMESDDLRIDLRTINIIEREYLKKVRVQNLIKSWTKEFYRDYNTKVNITSDDFYLALSVLLGSLGYKTRTEVFESLSEIFTEDGYKEPN